MIATDMEQAQILMNYTKSYFEKFKDRLKKELQYSLELKNNIIISTKSASFRGTRGHSVCAVIMDEMAFMRDENSANPCVAIINSLRPGMSTFPQALLLGVSSPYSASGYLYKMWKNYKDGHDSKIKIFRKPTRDLNPNISEDFIKSEIIKSPAMRSEYLSEWRKGISQFLDITLLDEAIQDITIMKPQKGIRYSAFCDPASGQGSDSMTLSIAHKEKDMVYQDFITEVTPPFSPKSVVKKFAEILRSYNCDSVTIDRYALGWVQDSFSDENIIVKYSEYSASEIYLKAETLFTMKRVRLLNNERQRSQWLGLERHTRRGRHGDLVTHMRGEHDDISNACAGAIVIADKKVFNDEDLEKLLPQIGKSRTAKSMKNGLENKPPWHDDAQKELDDFMRACGGRKI